MGLFRELGRQVEQFKAQAKAAADESPLYECADCGARFGDAYEACPECDSEDVALVEDDERA